jgi:hypothetical protein
MTLHIEKNGIRLEMLQQATFLLQNVSSFTLTVIQITYINF